MFKLVYDLNGISEVYGYACDVNELFILTENAVEDGIYEYHVERD